MKAALKNGHPEPHGSRHHCIIVSLHQYDIDRSRFTECLRLGNEAALKEDMAERKVREAGLYMEY